jgi:hypothetical protein
MQANAEKPNSINHKPGKFKTYETIPLLPTTQA